MSVPEYAPRVRANRQVFRELERDFNRINGEMTTGHRNAQTIASNLQSSGRDLDRLWRDMQSQNAEWLALAEQIVEMQAAQSRGETGRFRTERDLVRAIERSHRDAEGIKANLGSSRDAAVRIRSEADRMLTALAGFAR